MRPRLLDYPTVAAWHAADAAFWASLGVKPPLLPDRDGPRTYEDAWKLEAGKPLEMVD